MARPPIESSFGEYEYDNESPIDFFHSQIQRLMQANFEFTHHLSLDSTLDLQVLHLIDPAPEKRKLLQYHIVYESLALYRHMVRSELS
jgi:hypothetical protein